jgi:hypothetical protein
VIRSRSIEEHHSRGRRLFFSFRQFALTLQQITADTEPLAFCEKKACFNYDYLGASHDKGQISILYANQENQPNKYLFRSHCLRLKAECKLTTRLSLQKLLDSRTSLGCQQISVAMYWPISDMQLTPKFPSKALGCF